MGIISKFAGAVIILGLAEIIVLLLSLLGLGAFIYGYFFAEKV